MIIETLYILPNTVAGDPQWVFLGPVEGSQRPEIIGLPLGKASCGLVIQEYPGGQVKGAHVALVNEYVTVCGGDQVRLDCYSLDPQAGTWDILLPPMAYPVLTGKAITLPSSDMTIIGGFNYEHRLSTTLIYNVSANSWGPGPKMPEIFYFCAVPMNTSHTLVTSGYNEKNPSAIFIFDGSYFHEISPPKAGLLQQH